MAVGVNPSRMQARTSKPIPIRIESGDSCACAASSERGMARKVMPKALTNPAAARPPVKASEPTATVISAATTGCEMLTPGRSDWNKSHSPTKPFSGGSPAIATAPIRKNNAVHGIRLINPPIRFISRVWVACRTEPAPINISPLKAV